MPRRRQAALLLALCLVALPCAAIPAQQQQVPLGQFSELKDTLPQQTAQEYAARSAARRDLIAACRAKAQACEPARAGDDVQVERAGGHFDARLGWLREALKDAEKLKDDERVERMNEASERLASDLAQAAALPAPAADPRAARVKADAILAQNEFRMVDQTTEAERRWAMLMMSLNLFLNRLFSHVPTAPWAVPLLEWGILVLAAVGLALWAWRTTQQQRMAVALPTQSRMTAWQKESEDWARRAEREAAAANWREAVHCLYWSAIVLLEGQKLWRANRARTPREYLPLLEAGSPRRSALTGLTRIFERIWYGLRPAAAADFERAQALLEELRTA